MAPSATILLTLCLAALMFQSSASPLVRVRKNLQGSSDPNEEPTLQIDPMNPYDMGPVDSCEMPASDGFCGLNYAIPSSVAKIAHIIEGEIEVVVNNTVDNYDEICAAAIGDLHCGQRFPRCSEDQQSVVFSLSKEDCLERLTSNCPTDLANAISHLCLSIDTTAPIGNCRPATEYSEAENYQFAHCPVDSNMEITEWQYELLKIEDARLNGTSDYLRTPACGQLYKKYICQYVGRCWNEGQRVQIVNTIQDCEAFVNCYSDSFATLLMDLYQCSLWPSRFTPPPFFTSATTAETQANTETTATEATELTTQSTRSGPPTWPSAITPPEIRVGGGAAALRPPPLGPLLVTALLGLCLAALQL